jgi:hypothetical protein
MNETLKKALRDDIACHEASLSTTPHLGRVHHAEVALLALLEEKARPEGKAPLRETITFIETPESMARRGGVPPAGPLRRTPPRRRTPDDAVGPPLPPVPRGMKVIMITLTEYTSFAVARSEDGAEVDVLDEDATTTYAVGAAEGEEEAARLIADLCRARPPTNDGSGDEEEVCPIAHISLSCVELGAPLSPSGAIWWAHVDEDPDAASVLRQVRSKREARPKETA